MSKPLVFCLCRCGVFVNPTNPPGGSGGYYTGDQARLPICLCRCGVFVNPTNPPGGSGGYYTGDQARYPFVCVGVECL